MANIALVKLHFVDGRYGWTESHHLTGVGDLVASKPAVEILARARANLLCGNCTLPQVVVSMADVLGDSVVYSTNFFPGKDLKGFDSDFTWTSLKVRADGGPLRQNKRILFMPGIPDDMTIDGRGLVPDVPFAKNIENYKVVLLGYPDKDGNRPYNTGWGFMGLDKDPAGNGKKWDARIEGTGPTSLVRSAIPVAAGDKVRLSRVAGKLSSRFNGVWIVQAPIVAGVSFTIGCNGGTGSYGEEGTTVKKMVNRFFNYTSFDLMEMVTRKRGVGPGAPKGRRKKNR